MAYLETPDEEKDKQVEPGLLSGSGGSPLAPGAPAGTPQAPGSSPETGGAKPQFAELETYLNQNRPAAQQLGSRVAGEITKRGEGARSAITSGGQQFAQDVGKREVQQDVGLLNMLSSDPIGLAKDPDRKAAFERQRNASFSGPSSLEDSDFYSPISSAVGEAKRYGSLSETGGGIAEILGGAQQDRPYSQGAREFDASLALGDETARGEIGRARSSLSDIDARLGEVSAAARTRAQQGAATTSATQQAAQGALKGAVGSSNADLDARLKAARDAAAGRAQAARSSFASIAPTISQGKEGSQQIRAAGKTIRGGLQGLDAQALADLGLSAEQYQDLVGGGSTAAELARASRGLNDKGATSQVDRLYGQYGQGLGDLGRFLTERSPDSIGRESFATPDDYARAAALADLGGDPYLDQALAGQAGTANLDLIDFDLPSALAQRDAALEAIRRQAAYDRSVNSRSSTSGTVLSKAVKKPLSPAAGFR